MQRSDMRDDIRAFTPVFAGYAPHISHRAASKTRVNALKGPTRASVESTPTAAQSTNQTPLNLPALGPLYESARSWPRRYCVLPSAGAGACARLRNTFGFFSDDRRADSRPVSANGAQLDRDGLPSGKLWAPLIRSRNWSAADARARLFTRVAAIPDPDLSRGDQYRALAGREIFLEPAPASNTR